MIRIISALLLSLVTTAAVAQQKPLQLAPDAPDSHVVVRGDTLWGISAKFLKDPWRWPEIWRLNRDQINNPHWIYPGQVVVLDRSGATPRLRLAQGEPGRVVKLEPRIYAEQEAGAIPSIAQKVIEPFLSQPLVIDEQGMKDAPKIVATQEDRVVLGPGNTAYVANLANTPLLWQVYRPGKPLVDPETGEVLGYEAFYLGSARRTREGNPATVEIVTAKQEIGRGDQLTPATRAQIASYPPHAPATQVNGRVVAVYGGVNEAGRNAIVTLNRGTRDGIEVGHVLALYRAGAVTEYREDDMKEKYQLPDERYGLVFVFRTFDRVSYALVMNVTRPVTVADIVRTP